MSHFDKPAPERAEQIKQEFIKLWNKEDPVSGMCNNDICSPDEASTCHFWFEQGMLAAAQSETGRCGYCDDTGDVTNIIGEWRGGCICPAGKTVPTDKVMLDWLDQNLKLSPVGNESDRFWVLNIPTKVQAGGKGRDVIAACIAAEQLGKKA